MAPRLRPEVIAAIETAVELNDGQLESAFIHSLAKIYKTSPQAVVWNMKRYNKVKAGLDDRRKTGRRAAIDKDQAAEHIREMLAQTPGMKYDEIVEALFEKFDIRVSTTWVSRLLKNYEIGHDKSISITPRREHDERIRLEDTALEGPITQDGTNPLAISPPPRPINYPSFRQDLQQALGSSLINSLYTAAPPHLPPYQPQQPPPPPAPPAASRPFLHTSSTEEHTNPSTPGVRTLPVLSTSTPPLPNATTAPSTHTSVRKIAPPTREFVWKVVNVVELP